MKAVLISIRPEWCEKIASRKKIIEVRKTRPKLETPFKCYVYCTSGPGFLNWVNGFLEWVQEDFLGGRLGLHIRLNKKVIGEFVCDEMYAYFNVATDNWEHLLGNCHENEKEQLTQKALLSESQVHKYASGKNLYGWHISDLKIYDRPKELSEFNAIDGKKNSACKHRKRIYQNPDFNNGGSLYGSYYCEERNDFCQNCHKKELKRPPQSWCYVEEMEV